MSIRQYTSQQLIENLDSGKLSILNTLGAHDLKFEMVPIGRLCSFVVRLVCKLQKNNANLRKTAAAIIRLAAPAKLLGRLPKSDDTIVIGFNHPSLGEVCRLVYLGFLNYSNREFLFPVNLPWYESMVAVIPQLKRLNIRICPMITPATEAKLKVRFAGDDAKLKDIQLLKMIFDHRYIREVRAVAENNGVIFVAPSATRQKEIIGNTVNPSMTVLAHLVHKGNRKALFIPTAVFAPKHGNRELNLFRTYYIEPCEPFESEEVKALTEGTDRQFDYAFLKRIEKVYTERAVKLHLD